MIRGPLTRRSSNNWLPPDLEACRLFAEASPIHSPSFARLFVPLSLLIVRNSFSSRTTTDFAVDKRWPQRCARSLPEVHRESEAFLRDVDDLRRGLLRPTAPS